MDEGRLHRFGLKFEKHAADVDESLASLQKQADRLQTALEADSVCAGFGHLYLPPAVTLRARIAQLGWEIERRCHRCGEADGLWKPEHWTVKFPGHYAYGGFAPDDEESA